MSSILSTVRQKRPNFSKSRLTLIIGNSLCGKTTIVREIIQSGMREKPHPRWKKIILLCPTHHLNNSYNAIPDEWKFKDFDVTTLIKRIFALQEKKYKPEQGCIPKSEKILLILDDCIGIISGQNKILNEIAGTARHYNVDVIIISQHITGLASPIVRSNSTFTILGRMQDVNRKHIGEALSCYGNKNEVKNYINKIFSDEYRFIVLSNDPDDSIPCYTYKADLRNISDKFKIHLKQKFDDDLLTEITKENLDL